MKNAQVADAPVRPASQGPRARGREFSDYNVVAVFADLDAARQAIDALGRGGTEADTISLHGPAADRAAEETDMRGQDTAIMSQAGGRAVRSGVAGTVIGGLVGFAVGAIAVLAFDAEAVLIPIAVVCGAVGIGAVATILGVFSGLQIPQPWVLTFQDAPGRAAVGVHSQKSEDIEHAATVLRNQSPLEMFRADSGGRRLRDAP